MESMAAVSAVRKASLCHPPFHQPVGGREGSGQQKKGKSIPKKAAGELKNAIIKVAEPIQDEESQELNLPAS